MGLPEELGGIAEAASSFADAGELVVGVIAAEPARGERVYLCAYEGGDGRSWLALEATGRPLEDRTLVREAVSIAALCELPAIGIGGITAERVPQIMEAGAAGVAAINAIFKGADPEGATRLLAAAIGK